MNCFFILPHQIELDKQILSVDPQKAVKYDLDD